MKLMLMNFDIEDYGKLSHFQHVKACSVSSILDYFSRSDGKNTQAIQIDKKRQRSHCLNFEI